MAEIIKTGFLNSLKSRLENLGFKSFDFEYIRPKDLSPFEEWMKKEMDSLGIEKVKFHYKDGEITFSEVIHLIEHSSNGVPPIVLDDTNTNKSLNFRLVPKDKTYENNPMYNGLKHIKDTHVGMVKGMIFVEVRNEEVRKEVQTYLDKNRSLFEYAR